MTSDDLRRATIEALEPLPSSSGGIALVLATAAQPPAVAMLSSGDVLWRDDVMRVGIYASSSAVQRLAGAFTLLVPLGEDAVRVMVVDATATVAGSLARLEGTVAGVRRTAEPPWSVEMRFHPGVPDDPRLDAFVEYWAEVRRWLSDEVDSPPSVP